MLKLFKRRDKYEYPGVGEQFYSKWLLTSKTKDHKR